MYSFGYRLYCLFVGLFLRIGGLLDLLCVCCFGLRVVFVLVCSASCLFRNVVGILSAYLVLFLLWFCRLRLLVLLVAVLLCFGHCGL